MQNKVHDGTVKVTPYLYDSYLCRLCANENLNGTKIFPKNENESDLSQLINKYLPLKVYDDGKLPQLICPGCYIQVEATKQFLDLVLEGQKKLRDLLQLQETEEHLDGDIEKTTLENAVNTYVQTDENGRNIFIQVLSNGSLYPPEHSLSVLAAGSEKPKRRRGRPPKTITTECNENEPQKETKVKPESEDEPETDNDGRRKRKIKVPTRFQEVVQGKELERIFLEEGVIGEDSTSDYEHGKADHLEDNEIIGRLQSKDGDNLGELIIVNRVSSKMRNTFKNEVSRRRKKHEVCKKIFNHPSSLIYHREAEHNNGQRFVCIKCDKSFKHKQLLQRHQLVHSEERPYRCKQCDASFKTRANLINHMPIHTGEKKYFCSQCGQTFAHKTSLTLHIRWHSGQKPFQCDICLKSFSQKGNLAEHKRIHTGEKPYNCEHCNRKFTTSSQYKLHMKRHSGERPWRCEFCPKTFLHRDTWKCHTRRHKNEKPYQCEQCLKGFTEQCALKKHERLHTGEKPYVCEFCNRGFADCSNLAKHKRIHENEPNLIETPEIKVLTSSKDDENDIFYVTLDPNSSEIQSPSLVQIMEQLDTKNNENDEAHAKINNISTLSTKNNAVIQQIIDQEGNTMSVALPDGQMLRVVTTMENGEQNFKGLTNDGSLIPLNVNFEDERTIFGNEQMNVTLDEKENEFEEWTNKKKDDSKVATIPLIQFLDSDIQILPGQKMENNLQLLVEGQNVCFVTAYNSDDPTNSQYLAMA
ncbi:zinc finger protein 37-like [Agrilus planipennis]|uniref:Zinc finger protein 37-like n=1 Tax=Agrilus planipennis TaxID=224129 RepID=A0A7F5RHR0_AGRPL|nr:zinc finger protein 37-like [Agrilus planipennis]